jgi:hypothetical protein
MKTPYEVEQSITHFINSIPKAISLCCPQNQAKFRRRKKILMDSSDLSEAVAKSKRTFYLWKKAGSLQSSSNIYKIKRTEARKELRSIQRQQTAEKRTKLHEEIMESSDRDTKLFFKLIKNQRASSTADTQIFRVEQNEFTTPAEINETFRNHFANLAEPKQNLRFNEEHDRQVKIDAELIINICENSSVTIQPVTPTEISKLVATLKKKKAEDIQNLTAEHLQYGGSTISDYLASTINNIFYQTTRLNKGRIINGGTYER